MTRRPSAASSQSPVQDTSKRRACRISRFVRGVQLALMGAVLGFAARCSPLEGGQCASCISDCPGDLECIDGLCVRDDATECGPAGNGGGGGDGVSVTGTPETTSSSGGDPGTNTGTDGEAGASTGSPLDPCDPLPSSCTPELVTPRQLYAECSDEFSITLNARCVCDDANAFRNVKWKMLSGPDGLTLSEDGTLSGSGTLPDDDYEFVASAEIDGYDEVHDGFTLTVSDRCWVLFASDDDAGKPYVAAGRLNSDEVTALPEPPENAELVNFDTSPKGRFVARVSKIGASRVLDLVEFDQTEMVPHTLRDVPGSYIAHAFSRDERWLALVTTGLDDTTQTLVLVSLEAGPEVVARQDIRFVELGLEPDAYEKHLTWSDAGRILYVGYLPSDTDRLVVLERTVDDAMLGAETQVQGTQSQQGNKFRELIAGPSFYVVITSQNLVFAARGSDPVVHNLPEALSPDLRWLINDAGTDLPGSVIDPIASPPDAEPFATASECDFVHAWSSDGSTFLCTGEAGVFVYTISEAGSSLPSVQLAVPEQFPGESRRVALSTSGRWLAMVPEQDLVLVPKAAAYATLDEPALGPPTGTHEWDFFFTPAEERLVVQRGRSLFVFTLTEDSFSAAWEVEDIELPSVPDCMSGWAFDRELWCGAPRFRGNLLLSPGERHLAVVSDSGVVHVVDLIEQRVFDLGPVSQTYPEPSLQFL